MLFFASLDMAADAKKSSSPKPRVYNSMVVTAIDSNPNDNKLTVTATKNNVTYTIDATIIVNTKKIMRRNNAKAAFSEIMAGDNLKVWGTLSTIGATNTITATKIRDNSIYKLGSSLKGTVTDINRSTIDESGSSSYQQFNLHTRNRGDLLVRAYTATSIIFHGSSKSFSDLNNGDTVEVKGIWNKPNNLVYNTTRIKIKTFATTPTL
jgi:hypothetical protein